MTESYPHLVTQRSHLPGMSEPRTFEDALRDLFRNSPYLAMSMLLHAAIGAIFFLMEAGGGEASSENIIQATQEELVEPIPPEPPPPEKPPEEIEEIIEDPVVTEEVVDMTEIVDDVSVDADFDSTSINDVIGVGGGGGSGFGKLGRRASRGAAGGTATQRAVEYGLEWLAKHQNPEGYWSGAAFDEECGQLGDDVICDGAGGPLHDVGLTSLSLLAFLGAGETNKSGKYRDTVKRGLLWLKDGQDTETGNFANPLVAQHTYDHILATLVFCEAYALTQQHFLEDPANDGLRYMYAIRNPGRAWRYAPDVAEMQDPALQNDTSVTGWAIMAMTTARDFELDYDKNALDDAMLFFEEMTDIQGRTGYMQPGQFPPREEGLERSFPGELSESLTAVAVLCRIFADPDLKLPGNQQRVEQGVELIAAKPPEWSESAPGKRDFYYWYYGTYAFYQAKDFDRPGWKAWESALEAAIVNTQFKEGERRGSWDPDSAWGHVGGRVYSTAILTLCLEVFYRYDTVLGAH